MKRSLPIAELDILIVEDHKETRVALQHLLERWGHKVRSAGTLAEAFSSLSEQEFDVILLDIMLPDGQGFELLERASVGQAYVVVVSAWETGENVSKAAEFGCRDFLLKPAGVERLSACLGEAMREKASLQS